VAFLLIFRGGNSGATPEGQRGKRVFRLEKTLVLSLASVSQSCLPLLHVARGQLLFRNSRKSLSRNPREQFPGVSNWVQGLDLNQRSRLAGL